MIPALRRLLYLAAPIALWFLASAVAPPYIIAPPKDVFHLLYQKAGIFSIDLAITAFESLGGLLIGLFVAFGIAILFELVPRIESAIMPYAIAAKSVPIVAVAPLLVIWFGNGLFGKVLLAALICFFPLLVGFSDGLKSLPRELRYLAAIWSQRKVQTLRLVALPFAIPYLFSALKVAAPLSTVGAVVAEFSGANKGLGHATLVAAYHADAVMLFAAILLISLLGISSYFAVVLLELKFLSNMRVQRVIGTLQN